MIEIVSIPPLATVQDLGRHGYWHQGLGQAGAMDALSHRIANLLLDNDENAATIEIPLAPVRFRFNAATAFSIVGAVCGARLNQRALPGIWAGVATPGAVLELRGISMGARVYIGVPGGIDVPLVLGSRSTQLREGFGGFEGRMLAAGDLLTPVDNTWPDFPAGGVSLAMPALKRDGKDDIELRVLTSAEYHNFTKESRSAFWSTAYRVSPMINRQGYRLEGEGLVWMSKGELRSHGIVPGIVQVPGNGQPIIQLSDSATMGGYPAIGAVIEPDLWRIAQSSQGALFRFVRVELDEAARAQTEQESVLASLRDSMQHASELLGSW